MIDTTHLFELYAANSTKNRNDGFAIFDRENLKELEMYGTLIILRQLD